MDPEKWDEEKAKGLEVVLGKGHNIVMHALIPYALGGGENLVSLTFIDSKNNNKQGCYFQKWEK